MKKRHSEWQKKRVNDEDYRENQAQAHESWKRKNPDYWKNYRANNPEYTNSEYTTLKRHKGSRP